METAAPVPVDTGRIAQDLQIRRVQVESVIQLLDEGNTIPFITRYRKERTGNLNEVVIREIQARVRRLRELAERKETILKTIEGQGKLTDDLRDAILAADNPKRLEDLYLPFKPKKRTKAGEAREKGLEPLAVRIWNRDETLTDLPAAAAELINAEKGVETAEQVLEGVGHILAESISELAGIRDAVRRAVWKTGKIGTVKSDSVPEGQGLDFRDYFNYSEPVNHVPPHRVLAINRGTKEGTLKVKLDVPRQELERALFSQLPLDGHPHQETFARAAIDALDRLLLPSLEREVWRDLTEAAERHAVDVFARNLRSLLLQPPIHRQVVLAIDPGFRTGCKVAVLDLQGNLLAHDVIHPHPPQNRRAEAKVKLKDLVAKHQVNVVAIGNGTAGRETEEFIAELIAEGTYFHENPGATSLPGRPGAPAAAQEAEAEAAEATAPEPATESATEPAATAEPTTEPTTPPETETPTATEPEAVAAAEGSPAAEESPVVEPIDETPPPIMGGAPEDEPASPPPAEGSNPEVPNPEGSQPNDPEPAPPEAVIEAATATPEAEAPTQEPATEPEPAPAVAAEGSPAAEGSSAAESEGPAPVPAADFTHPPVGPKPKPQREPRPPRPKQPPPPPRPHAADPLLAQLAYVIVNEAGASVYSTSTVGREEFPDLDATSRSAVSIGRRLQDPLAELVKIEPQNIGVGLYQHDIDAKLLKESLDTVIESCVNFVGVDLNTASVALLRHVSGLNALTAKRLFDARKERGGFTSREQIKEIEGIGPVTFTQAAGFLKIRDDAHPFDRTWIHPESYEAATTLLERLGLAPEVVHDREKLNELNAKLAELDFANTAKELNVGEPTLRDIADALARPERDPREDLPKPIFKKDVLKLEDLSPGMDLKGTVLNVVDFGAFVDIGLKDSGLVHISQLANRYIKSPHDVVHVGDVVTVWVMGVDAERKRVSLTMVQPGTERPRGPQGGGGRRGGNGGGERSQGGEGGGDRPPRGERAPRGPRRDRAPSGGEGGEGQGGSGGTPPAPARGLRIPGPPQRLQNQRGRGGPGGRGGRGGGRFERRDPAPAAPAGGEAPRPKPKPPAAPQPLSKDAIAGNVPLRSFGQLKQFFETRSKSDEPDTPDTDTPTSTPVVAENPSADAHPESPTTPSEASAAPESDAAPSEG